MKDIVYTNTLRNPWLANEIVRRLQNTSRKLDWDLFCAPVVTEYMLRMKRAGYNEDYRKHVLLNAFAVYDSKIQKDREGVCPLNRPVGYRKFERRKEKAQKKRNWSTRPIFRAKKYNVINKQTDTVAVFSGQYLIIIR